MEWQENGSVGFSSLDAAVLLALPDASISPWGAPASIGHCNLTLAYWADQWATPALVITAKNS